MTRSVETPEDGARNPKRRSPAGDEETVPEGYGTHGTNRAVSDACCVYRYRNVEHNLRKFGRRRARKRVLRHRALSGQWVSRGRAELRLRRRALELRIHNGGNRFVGWKDLQEFVRARRC